MNQIEKKYLWKLVQIYGVNSFLPDGTIFFIGKISLIRAGSGFAFSLLPFFPGTPFNSWWITYEKDIENHLTIL